MNDKELRMIIFPPDTLNIGAPSELKPDTGQVLMQEEQNLGDYSIVWAVLYGVDGREISRWNAKYLEGIIYR